MDGDGEDFEEESDAALEGEPPPVAGDADSLEPPDSLDAAPSFDESDVDSEDFSEPSFEPDDLEPFDERLSVL